jgi:hypothetical protein
MSTLLQTKYAPGGHLAGQFLYLELPVNIGKSLSFRVESQDLLCPKGEDKILHEGDFKK